MVRSAEASGPLPQSPEIHPYEFPEGYFDAQVRFAQKWAQISGEDFAQVLAEKTALRRRVTNGIADEDEAQAEWERLTAELDPTADPSEITQQLYIPYTRNPENKYRHQPGKQAFGYDYYPDRQLVKIHFDNPQRGTRPLSDEAMPQRREELRALLQDVREMHPEAALLMSATWLRSTNHYRALSPPDIAEQENLMSPDMKLTGNSTWGQFIDANGYTNQRVYQPFKAAVEQATTLDELVAAFPHPTLRAVDPIQQYYGFYGVGKSNV